MNQDRHDTNLHVLLADLFASDERDLEQLVRYAKDEDSLTPGERAEVEARLESDAGWADRLRVLRTFDPSALPEHAERDEGTLPAHPSREATPVVMLDVRRTRRMATVIGGGLAAAAALTIWLLPLLDSPTKLPSLDSVTIAVPSGTASPSADRLTPPSDSLDSIDDPGRVRPAPEPEVELAVEQAPASSDLRSGVEPSATEPIRIAEAEPAETGMRPSPRVPSSPAPAVVADAVDANADELQIAMLGSVVYEAPVDRALRAFLGDDMRGDVPQVTLAAWVPDHVAQSATPQPTLYWEIEGQLPDAHRLGFVITSETETEPLYEGTLDVPVSRGRQAIDLAELGVRLAEETVYRWTVFARAPSTDPSEDRITQGWVQFRSMPQSLAAEWNADSDVERASHFAASGYWYDALSLLVGLSERHPEDDEVSRALSRFLASAGVERVRSIE